MDEVLEHIGQAWQTWDTQCSHAFRYGVSKLGFKEMLAPPAPTLVHLPFVSSPTPLITSIIGYLLIILIAILSNGGKSEPKKRDAWWIRRFVQLHNAFLVVLSTYMSLTVVYEAVSHRYNLWGNNFDPNHYGMARIIYIFYLSKVYEFVDTMIMIVKGNMRQVSFLHVYHHVSVSIIWWVITYVAPGGDAYYSAALNSLVHVVMYTYYFLASTFQDENVRRKYLWWGPYLTIFQMSQFVTMFIQAIYVLHADVYNRFLAQMLVVYMVTLLTLFGNFFVQKYMKGGAQAKKAKAKAKRV